MTGKYNKVTIWNDCLESIKVSVSEPNYNTWFKQSHLFKLDKVDDRFIAEIGCSSPYVKSTLEGKYFGLIQDSLSKLLEAPCDLLFLVKEPKVKKQSDKPSPLFDQTKPSDEELNDKLEKSNIRLIYTFDNYAVSSTNQMAWAAAEAVVQNPGTAYNPLFIWGGVGVGKTHLMNSIGYALIKSDNALTLFCTGEQFTNDIVEGIRSKSTQRFREKYRKLDTLLIDDIQFIAGKDAVQEEFFHTFNALAGSGKQVILASDKPPSEISKLEERLRSRFEAGLIVDVSPPDFELRVAIIQIKSSERGMDLETEQIHLIASNINTARELEGFLVKLSSVVKLKGADINEDLIKSLLGKRDTDSIKSIKANPNDVIGIVSKYFSIGKRDLLGSSRARPVARPRQILMYILRIDLDLPYQEVGNLVGNRDHTTVMHAVNKITTLSTSDVQIREDIMGIKNML
jgi:chromosomal replication initiator protein